MFARSVNFILFYLVAFNWQSFCTTTHDSVAISLPKLDYKWRPDDVIKKFKDTKFPIDHPLTTQLMSKGMPRLSSEELHRFLPLLKRLSSPVSKNMNITVVSLGGSVGLGVACCVGNSWPNRFIRWLQLSYPLVNIKHLPILKSSTNSLFGMSAVKNLKVHIDLLIVGYAMNDEV
jgi:hypothetical protein